MTNGERALVFPGRLKERKPETSERILQYMANLQAGRPTAKVQAIKMFRRLRMAEPLIEALADRNPFIRGKTVDALARLKEPGILNLLFEVLKDDGSSKVRWAALLAIESFQDARIAPALVERLDSREEPSSQIRARMVSTIGKLENKPQTYEFLKKIADYDPSNVVKKAVKDAIASLDEKELDLLIDKLSSSDNEVKRDGIIGLAAKHSMKATNALIGILENDESSEIRILTANALKAIGSSVAKDALEHAAQNDPDDNVRSMIQEALDFIRQQKP